MSLKLRPTDRTALVTHRNCLDGTGCAVIFEMAGGNGENVFFRDPRKSALTPEEAAPFDEVWFADVCPPDLTDPAGGKPWWVFDHHETNVNRHLGNPGCVFRKDQCGCSILASNVVNAQGVSLRNNRECERIITMIEHHDLGRFDADPDVMFIANLAVSVDQRTMVSMLSYYQEDIFSNGDFRARAQAIGDYHKILAEKSISNSYATELTHPDGSVIKLAIVVSPHFNVNTVANTILDGRKVGKLVPGAVAVVCYDAACVSLRSRGTNPVNVARIAELFGGGGHPQAAGFGLDRSAMKRLFELVFS